MTEGRSRLEDGKMSLTVGCLEETVFESSSKCTKIEAPEENASGQGVIPVPRRDSALQFGDHQKASWG